METTNLTEQQLEKLYRQTAIFSFEKNFDPISTKRWMRVNFPTGVAISVIYLIIVYFGRIYMKDKKPLSLKNCLAVWNGFLAAFSLLAFVRMAPEFRYVLYNNGIGYSVCDNTLFYVPQLSVWYFIFAMSKIAELIDTFFIIVRKRPLTVLHWYHHALTMIFSWYCFTNFVPTCRWSLITNSFIHSLMYSYYALRAIGRRIPKSVSVLITSLQIVQMLIGCWSTVIILRIINDGLPCDVTLTALCIHGIVYFSYFLLFCNFFYKSYINKSNPRVSNKSD